MGSNYTLSSDVQRMNFSFTGQGKMVVPFLDRGKGTVPAGYSKRESARDRGSTTHS